ncbi:HAMP domain-containing sensor histidine kinase [Chitinophaga sp.]|uniref:HAMP domain-containing sensor histidine kinase n=1 Tax=Chitinophaga sp. TaxID=1869181 RepID=UPI0031D6EF54
MKIRHRLALQFTILSGCILLVIFVLVYLLLQNYVNNTFFSQLEDRALITAQVFLEKDELAKKKWKNLEKKYIQSIPGEDGMIYDEENQPVFIDPGAVSIPSAIIQAVRYHKKYRFHYKGKPAVGLYYSDNQGNFVIFVTAGNEAGQAQLVHNLWILAGTFALGMLMVFVIGQWFSYRALRPINFINTQVKNIRAANLHARVKKSRNEDEIDELASNFNDLLEHLEKAFQLQQSFVSNASHELRTPLTAIITELEVILQKQRNQEDYIKTLRSVLDESAKLKTITNGLLELTQADTDTYAGKEHIRLDELLWDLREEWVRKHPEQLLNVQMLQLPEDATRLEITGNRELLALAIKNIIKNAFKFSSNQPVDCTMNCQQEQLLITITDKGIGISPEDAARIFMPLFRANNARIYPGFGIGLSMAQKIIQAHKGQISVSSEPGQGSTFNVSFTTHH